jgi:hypothetical protein
MSRRDYLWVGLNLLAAYLVATGCIEAGMFAYERSGLDTTSASPFYSPTFKLGYHDLVRAGLTVLEGAALALAAWGIGRSRCDSHGQASDYSDLRRPSNAAESRVAPQRGPAIS